MSSTGSSHGYAKAPNYNRNTLSRTSLDNSHDETLHKGLTPPRTSAGLDTDDDDDSIKSATPGSEILFCGTKAQYASFNASNSTNPVSSRVLDDFNDETPPLNGFLQPMKSKSFDTDDDGDYGDETTPLNGFLQPIKSTGFESDDDDDDDNIILCGTEEKMMASDGKPAKKKSRTEERPIETKSVKNWKEQHRRTEVKWESTKFVDVFSGDPLYSWLGSATKKVSRYDSEIEKGVSPLEYDQNSASGCWTSARINLVRPLVKAFKNCGAKHSGKRMGKSHSHRPAMPTLSHRRNSDSGVDFFNSAPDLECSTKCKNHRNQNLYAELVNYANFRLGIGRARRNLGHYQNAKNWCYVAQKILVVSCFS